MSGILPVLRRSHRVLRCGLGALWLGLLVFQSLNGLTSRCSDEMQPAATVSEAATGEMVMHSATNMPDWSVTSATEPVPADAASVPLPTQPVPFHHAAMTVSCQGCVNVAATVVADVSMSVSVNENPFPLLHTSRSQRVVAPDARPPKA